jgi:hypothetical protein
VRYGLERQPTLRAAALILLVIGSVGDAWCAPPQSVTKPPAWIQFGLVYKPRNPRSLAEIPESIRLGLLAHLQERLGESFYRRLEFTGGQIVDIDELHRVDPGSLKYQWEVPAYTLHFTFHMPEIGLESYTAQIELRKDGMVLQEIDLPDFADDPKKLNFTSLASALETAKAKGFDLDRISAEVAYDPNADDLTWRLREVSHDDVLNISFKNIDIDLHSGKVMRVYDTAAIR